MLPKINRKLTGLCPCVRKRVREIRKLCAADGVSLQTIETLREIGRQRYYVKRGVSWTLESYHLPQEPRGLSLAIDMAPRSVLAEPQWYPDSPDWVVYGRAVRKVRMRWGGSWRKKDKPHAYLKTCGCPAIDRGST